MVKTLFSFLIGILAIGTISAQTQPTQQQIDSLKKVILSIDQDVAHMQLNLDKAQKKFKAGMIVSTIGYSVVIAGGQMLGRENDDLGQALLYTGGAIGISGTYILLDSFKYFGRAGRRKGR